MASVSQSTYNQIKRRPTTRPTPNINSLFILEALGAAAWDENGEPPPADVAAVATTTTVSVETEIVVEDAGINGSTVPVITLIASTVEEESTGTTTVSVLASGVGVGDL